MKKIIIISSLILVVLLSSTIGYKVVSANTKIDEIDDIITIQEKEEDYLTYYNYTLDNPNIILNPYNISPLSAIIIFETKTEEEANIVVKGKDENSTYKNTFQKTKFHYIPVLGLYPDYNNEIIITCGNKTKKFTIKTSKLPNDLQAATKENNTNNLYFISTDKYTYAIDNNNEVRWYLTKKYNKKISRLTNGHLLLSNDTMLNNNDSSGLVEIDLLGKVYNEYDVGTSYKGSYAETNKTILVLSSNLLEIDKKSGELLRKINLDDSYKKVVFDNTKNQIILAKDNKVIQMDYNSEDTKISQQFTQENENEALLQMYNFDSYEITKGNRFINNKKTLTSNKNILLLNYKSKDKNYSKYNIKLKKESDKLIIKGNFDDKNSYLILDKFLGKKVYSLKKGINYINNTGLSGDYSIYIKVNDRIYKTNKYITF